MNKRRREPIFNIGKKALDIVKRAIAEEKAKAAKCDHWWHTLVDERLAEECNIKTCPKCGVTYEKEEE